MFCYRFNGFCASLEMDGKSTGFFARPMRTCRKPVSQMRNFSPTNDRNYEGQAFGPKTEPGKKSFWFHFYTFGDRLHLPLAFATLLELSPFSTIYLRGGDVAGGQVALYGQLGNISAERHFSGDVELKVYQKNVCRDENSSNLFSSTGNCWHERECGIRRRSMREKSKYRSRGCSSRFDFAFNGQLHRQTRSISFRL